MIPLPPAAGPPSIHYTWLVVAAVLAVIEWTTLYASWQPAAYAARLGTLAALLGFVGQHGGFASLPGEAGHSLAYFTLGLLCALAGDILLIWQPERFMAGLVALLAVHISYISGFGPLPPLKPVHVAAAAILVIAAAIPTLQIYRRLVHNMSSQDRGRYGPALLWHTLGLGWMLLAASFTFLRATWHPFAALAVVTGAALLYVSNLQLVWARFVAPRRSTYLASRIAYHLGQFLIILGAVQHFMK